MSFINCKIVCCDANPADYHKQEAQRGFNNFVIGRSELMEFARCPHRWKEGYRDGDNTEATTWGSLIDCLLLTPDRFSESYVVTPATYPSEPKKKGGEIEQKPWNWNATYCKDWREQQTGKTVIKPELLVDAQAAIQRLKDDKQVAYLLAMSSHQVWMQGEWQDHSTGITVPVKALIDMLPSENQPFGVIDLKTSQSAAPSAWPRVVYQRGYDVQAAWYLDMLAACGDKRDTFQHIIQESFAPWEVGRRELSAEFIRLGRDRYIEAMNLYCHCLAHNDWPTYDEDNTFTLTEPEAWMVINAANNSTGGKVTVEESLGKAGL